MIWGLPATGISPASKDSVCAFIFVCNSDWRIIWRLWKCSQFGRLVWVFTSCLCVKFLFHLCKGITHDKHQNGDPVLESPR